MSLVLSQRLVERLFRLLGSGAGLRNFPLHLSGANFILRDAAGLAGICVDHRRGALLHLPRPPCCHQDVSVVAVKAFDQLHWDSPLKTGSKFNHCRASNIVFRTMRSEHCVPNIAFGRLRSTEHGQLSGCPVRFYTHPTLLLGRC